MSRTIKTWLVLLSLSLTIFSCEKEYSEENGGAISGGSQSGTADFDLAGAPGNCTTPAVTGTFTVGTALTSSEKITLIVDVTSPGTYTISTGTVNGVKFSASGTFTTAGATFIELTAVGNTPTAAGTFSFSAGTNGCSFPVTFNTGGTSSGTSIFTFAGAPNDCTAPVISGTYTEGVALTAANTIKLSVNVTQLGTYSITTATANGIKFSATGTFTTTGAQDLILTGSGTPGSQGEISYTAGTNGCAFKITFVAPAPAAFTLDGSPGSCAGFVLAGTYMAGTATGAANTVSLKVVVTSVGAYTITTNTANGITFSKTGNFTALGATTVVLTANGTPTAAGPATFSPQGVASTCSFVVTTVPAPTPAVYTLAGAPAACTAAIIAGTYVAGTGLAASNTVSVDVNVTGVGPYTLTTNVVNGYKFTATGTFTTTGPQTVVLKGSGTPVAAGVNTFTPQIGTSGCTFPVTVTAPTNPCTGLEDGKFSIVNRFTIDGATFAVSFNGQYQVSIQDGFIKMDVFFPGGSKPAPGVYNVPSVTITCPDAGFISNAVTWNATSGKVYVSTGSNGEFILEFCNVNFTGTSPIGGGPYAGVGQGKVVL